MCDRRCAGKEKDRSHPGWSHLYGLSFSRFNPPCTNTCSSAVGVSAESPSSFVCVCIPFMEWPPRYKSEGGGTPICLRTPSLLSIVVLACTGLIGECPTVAEDIGGERWDEGGALDEISNEVGVATMCEGCAVPGEDVEVVTREE